MDYILYCPFDDVVSYFYQVQTQRLEFKQGKYIPTFTRDFPKGCIRSTAGSCRSPNGVSDSDKTVPGGFSGAWNMKEASMGPAPTLLGTYSSPWPEAVSKNNH